METDPKYALVGAVTLSVCLLLFVTLFWMAKTSPGENTARYLIYFKEQNLSGLQIGSPVSMKGMRVGTVSLLDITPENIEVARVEVELQAELPVKTDTKAILTRNLLTGYAAIDLTDSTQQAPLLMDLQTSDDYPVIKEGTSEFQEIASNIPEVLDEFAHTLTRISIFLDDDNKESVNKILENFVVVTDSISEESGELSSMIKNLNQASNSIKESAKNIESISSDISSATSTVVEDVDLAFVKISALAEDMETQIRNMSNSLSSGLQLITQGSSDITKSIDNLSVSISRTLENYENPKEIIFGAEDDALGPGE